jgi:poly-gamma-glutamate synthesis protein (capsule biosynthesis protein)
MRMMLTGDLVLEAPEAPGLFADALPLLRQADVLIGHVETPHTTRGVESVGDIPAPASPPKNLAPLRDAGFAVATLAGNHIHDRGAEGIADTIETLAAYGVASTGAGLDLARARRPAVVERAGKTIAVLSYNCVGPAAGWGGPRHAGCAYIKVISHYEQEGANPGGPPKAYTFADPDTIEAMQADIEAAKAKADIVVVAFHKGLVHTPAKLAMYERPVARAAIDAGADIVIGHHAHILRGVELYRGKPIFHGLGNFITVTRALNIEGNDNPARLAWAKRRRELFGFEPDPNYPLYPFHPEAKNVIVADCIFAGALEPGFSPLWMQENGAPLPLGRGPKGQEVFDYVTRITREAGLKAEFAWSGDRIVFG